MPENKFNVANIKIKKLATGFTFAEGPLLHPDGFLLFSDTPANKIFKVTTDGNTTTFLDNSGWDKLYPEELSDMVGSNGLALDAQRLLIICQHGNHAIARYDGHTVSSITADYKGRSYNSPNDIVVADNDCIYFTDPPYGLKDQVLMPDKYQPHGGIYCLLNGVPTLVATDLEFPNGICISNNGQHLFVSSSNPEQPAILKYAIEEPGKVSTPVTFADINADGIKADSDDRLYCATSEGIKVLDEGGNVVTIIELPEEPSNLCWGDKEQQTLFVTARTSIYQLTGFNTTASV